MHADTPQPRVVLGSHAKGLNVGPGMDATGVRLEGCQFIGQDLSRAKFDGCDLYGVVIRECDLSDASFRRAHLTGMFVSDCKIGGADFTNATINGVYSDTRDLRYPRHDLVLSKQQLLSTRSYKMKNLDRCVIRGYPNVDFSYFSIRSSNLHHGEFDGCNFSGAYLDHSGIADCTLSFKQLASINDFDRGIMTNVGLAVRLSGQCDFSGMDLTGSGFGSLETPEGRPIPSLDFSDAIVRYCGFGNSPDIEFITSTHLHETRSYKSKDLRGIRLSNFDLKGSDFHGFDLVDAAFRDCDVSKVSFVDAVITNMYFSQCIGLSAQQIRSTWNYKNDRMDGIDLPSEIEAELKVEEDRPMDE